MVHYTYLLIDIASVLLPFIFSFHPGINFYHKWSSFWPACLISAAVFIVWDIAYTKLGVWGFDPHYLCGLYIYNLPIEECLFFICIPYASIFTFHCLTLFKKRRDVSKQDRLISFILILILGILILLNVGKLYTTAAMGSLLILLLWASWNRSMPTGFYFNYLIILVPFFIVNGILTGSFINQPIVWYNDQENMGIRLGTIPLEDIFYGMSLLLLNNLLYEFFLKKNTIHTA